MNQDSRALINRDETILVIIDMQERLFPAMAEKERLLENVMRLVKFSKIMGLPVLLTEQEKLGSTLREIREEVREVEPIDKVDFNCFRCEHFRITVAGHQRKTLLLAGIEAHICVAQTALHAACEYTVHAVGDAIASRSPHNHRIAVERMMRSGITVTSTEMALYEILERAGSDTFRAVLKLVK
ncbi:MAG: isochorismatase family protein [Deltaproteobacteria bacterium]|nr:isochorismatase family protein [Deltaproteobacteria bacterium]